VRDSRKRKAISRADLVSLGLKEEASLIVNNIEDLKKYPSNIIIAESQKTFDYRQNVGDRQTMLKKEKYVMSIGFFYQIHYDVSAKIKLLKPSDIKFSKVYRPYNGQSLENKKLLVWRQGGIGDLLFISPNLRYLKELYPTCQIVFGCGPQYQTMVKEWDFVDKIVDMPFTFSTLSGCDYHSMFEGVIERTKQAESENAYGLFTKWMNLNLPKEKLYPQQKPNDLAVECCKKILSDWNIKEKEFIIIQPRASSPIRTPRPLVWKTIIDRLTQKDQIVVITDSRHNSNGIEEFRKTLNNPEKVFNFASHSDELSKSIAMTSLSKLAIGIDSSLLHIAESLDVRGVGIFGPFPGKIRLETYRFSDWIDCKSFCSPCFIHSSGLCRNSKAGYVCCYDNINYDQLMEKVFKYV
jgi:ADP-heptose:LPS heptosyltransferase